MKKKTAGILLGVIISAALLAGCGKNEATEAANESVETEKEGNGEDAETEEAGKTETTDSDAASDKKTEGAETASEGTEEEAEEPAQKVGVLLPSDRMDNRWSVDSTELKSQLEEDGYEPEILFAEEDTDTQISQLRSLLQEENLSAVIITPVDEYALTEVLEEAAELSVPVFDYDKLIMDTDNIKYFVTFDTRKIGQQIAEELIDKKELDKAREAKESYTIEFLMGEPDDNASLFLFNGIMEVLQEYFDDGTLVCRSEKTTFDDTAIMRLSTDTAKTNLEEIMSQYYAEEGVPDIICTAYDGFAQAAMELLEEKGIEPGTENWPFVTGLGAKAYAVKSVAEEKMGFTVFMDSRTLAEECVKMVDTYLKGDDVEVEDYNQYDNGVKLIGACTCDGRVIDKDNYRILVDNGFYEEAEIAPEPTDAPVPTEKPEPTDAPIPTEKPESTDAPIPTLTPEPTVTSEEKAL
ncbi:MAG: substrate-binding domain-containing protein [Blautia sp.]|nr:substrate-binding domain-containing protein [Blautia sp.]